MYNDKKYQRAKTLFDSEHARCALSTGAIFAMHVGEKKTAWAPPHHMFIFYLFCVFPTTTGVFLIILNDTADNFYLFESLT